jgi:hypothetical protein
VLRRSQSPFPESPGAQRCIVVTILVHRAGFYRLTAWITVSLDLLPWRKPRHPLHLIQTRYRSEATFRLDTDT